MKKHLLLLLVLISWKVSGQTNTFPESGNVGIGTTSPSVLFHVVHTAKEGVKTNLSKAILENRDMHLDLISGPDDFWGSAINFVEGDGASNVDVWSIVRQTTNGAGDSSLRFNFGSNNQHDNPNKMILTPGGNMGIGTSAPTHKLEVNGTIKTKEVNVTATGWADFVFKADYELMPLPQVDAFIQEHGHLPSIPTETEVMENGVSLGEMNVKLLEKIEELTLYTISQESSIKEQRELINELIKRIDKLENKN